MKTSTIIIAAVLTLQAGILFAGNDNAPAASNDNSVITLVSIAPATPAEATFEEVAPINEFVKLVPATPAEATFDDVAGDLVPTCNLAPLTPDQADFIDAVDTTIIDNGILSPVAPTEADFE